MRVPLPTIVPTSNTRRRIVETTGARMFGLEEAEVQERRAFVEHVRREIEVRPMPARMHHAHYDDTEG